MSPRAGYSPSRSQHPSTHQTKNVDAAPQAQGFSGLDFSRLGHVSNSFWREALRKKSAAVAALSAESAKEARIADSRPSPRQSEKAAAAREKAEAAKAELDAFLKGGGARPGGRPAAPAPLSPDEIVAADIAALDREEAGNTSDTGMAAFLPPRVEDLEAEERNHRAVARFLPPEFAVFLDHMNPQRRAEREKAILDKVAWDGLEILALPPVMLAERAGKEARRHAAEFPKADKAGNPTHQEPEHRKRRCEKWQLRRLRKMQRKALRYVEKAVGAVGGPKIPGRALNISDYCLAICEEEERQTQEVLGRQRLAKKLDLSVQIPMLDLHWRAKAADAAKRRLLIDVHLARWRTLGWSVCWLTVTLPPEYVCHATNEERRVTGWDVELGPDEAMARLQDDHHRTLNLLREKGVRLSGWWNVQPQQSGTPHRHYVVACETLADARKVCDEFHARFDTGNRAEDGQDRGCAAYVIGDDDPRYAPRQGKNGKEETAESVAKYAARYATRYETRPDEAKGDEGAEAAPADGGEQARFRGWKKLQGVRGMGFLGLDSQRAPLELWDVLWLNSLKDDDRWFSTDDARMSLAMREMRISRKKAEDAAFQRGEADRARDALKTLEAIADAVPEAEVEAAAIDVAEAEAAAREAAEAAAFHGWHAALAAGLWPDADMDAAELAWLNDAVGEWNQERAKLPDGRVSDVDPLPPVPLREERESVYGVQRKEIRGAVGVARRFTLSSRLAQREELFATAADAGFLETFQVKLDEKQAETSRRVNLTGTRRLFFLAARDAGLGVSRRPDGTVAGYDLSGEILLRSDDEWIIVTVEEAGRMKEETGDSGPTAAPLSVSATDPRIWPDGHPHGHERPPG